MAGPLDRAFVEIVPDFDKFPAAVRKGVSSAGKDIERELSQSLSRAEKNAARDGNRIGSTTGKSFSDGLADALSSIAGIKLPAGGFLVLGSAMAAAAASAVQLAAAVAPAAGIIAGLPSAIGVAAAGMSTLNVATAGVADAFGSALTDDAEAFGTAMEGLAPNVQSAAQALRDLDPELEALRNSVQDAFFEGFDGVLSNLAKTLLGPVTEGMTSVAEAMNGVVLGLTNVATSASAVEFVNQSFAIMAQIITSVQEPLAELFSALLNVGTSINAAFGDEAGAGLADLITQFAEFLNTAASSGAAVAWVSNALTVFEQLGAILSPIVGILGSIGAAASSTGGNILGVFGQILGVFDEFLASVEGQEVLTTLFEALNIVGAAFADVLSSIAPALPPIIDGISNILRVVAPLIGPLSELVGSILTALAPVLSVIASAIAPIIGPLSTVVELLGGILAEAITAVMPLIETIAELLGNSLGAALEVIGAVLQAVAPIFTVLFEALGPIIEALTPLFELLGVVADIISAVLAPVIQVLGDILLWLVDTIIVPLLVPVIELLAEMLRVVLVDAINYLVEVFTGAWEGLGVLFGWLKDQFDQQMEGMRVIFGVLQDALKRGADFIRDRVVNPTKQIFSGLRDVFSGIVDAITGKWSSAVTKIKEGVNKIKSGIGDMFAPLWTGFKSAINSVINGWNRLSFTLPSVDVPGIGQVGGFTLNTPNIPTLQTSGFSFGEGLVNLHPNEAVVNAKDSRGLNMLASAMSRAADMSNDRIGVQTAFAGAGSAGDTTIQVFIGERELTDIVTKRIDESNQNMLRRARSATGRTR